MSNGAVKVAIIGPKESGKTKVTNIITNNFSSEDVPYDPTVGVRIISHVHEQDLPSPIETEIWDCSGDQAYEPCWPAILQDLDAIIVCFDPTSQSQVNDSRVWCEWFAIKAQLFKGQVALFSITEDKTTQHAPLAIHNGTCNVPIANVNTAPLHEGAPPATRLFSKILIGIQKAKALKQQQQQQQ